MYDDLRLPYQKGTLPSLELGRMIVDNKLVADAPVYLLLKSFNRHGLIAGATGSGKTKTIQVLSEQLSLAGVPSLVMDIKGDISGLAMPGEANDKLLARAHSLNLEYTPRSFPVEFLALGESHNGLPLRSTVTAFGPILFARILDANETQKSGITVLFEFAKEENIPLITLADVKSLLQYLQTDEGKNKAAARFGSLASSSLGIIMRKIIELETQGGEDFFGEPAFDVQDLIRVNQQNSGIISIFRLMELQDKPQLFSTFMLKLLSDLYAKMPELGDPDKPRLMLFIDEAHLIFNQASKALLSLLDTMVKLIRSKGIGLIFCTQTPNDIPESVLSQLGLKIQHSLRAFTAKDRKAMKLIAQNFPSSTYYDTEQLLTALGIGEALVSALDAKGQPTPLIQCMIRAPESRMGVLTDQELGQIIKCSAQFPKYQYRKEGVPASAVLASRQKEIVDEKPIKSGRSPSSTAKEPSIMAMVTKNTLFRQIVRQIFRELTRAIMSAFKKR